MKSCALVSALILSKVMTTAPARPVPARSRSFAVSSVSLNWGVFGLKKRRGCGSKVNASAGRPWARPISSAAAMTARWPRWTPSKLPIATTAPLGIALAGVASRIVVKAGIGGWNIPRLEIRGRDGELAVLADDQGSQAAPFACHALRYGGVRPEVQLTGCLRHGAIR